jgi:hypothetical protein
MLMRCFPPGQRLMKLKEAYLTLPNRIAAMREEAKGTTPRS